LDRALSLAREVAGDGGSLLIFIEKVSLAHDARFAPFATDCCLAGVRRLVPTTRRGRVIAGPGARLATQLGVQRGAGWSARIYSLEGFFWIRSSRPRWWRSGANGCWTALSGAQARS